MRVTRKSFLKAVGAAAMGFWADSQASAEAKLRTARQAAAKGGPRTVTASAPLDLIIKNGVVVERDKLLIPANQGR